jgi:hypothetical protein
MVGMGRRGVNEGDKAMDAGEGKSCDFSLSCQTAPRWYGRGKISVAFYAAFCPFFASGLLVRPV